MPRLKDPPERKTTNDLDENPNAETWGLSVKPATRKSFRTAQQEAKKRGEKLTFAEFMRRGTERGELADQLRTFGDRFADDIEKRLERLLENKLSSTLLKSTAAESLAADDQSTIHFTPMHVAGILCASILLMDLIPAKIEWTEEVIDNLYTRIAELGDVPHSEIANDELVRSASASFRKALLLLFYRPNENFIHAYFGFTMTFHLFHNAENRAAFLPADVINDPSFYYPFGKACILHALCMTEDKQYFDEYGPITIGSMYQRISRPLELAPRPALHPTVLSNTIPR